MYYVSRVVADVKLMKVNAKGHMNIQYAGMNLHAVFVKETSITFLVHKQVQSSNFQQQKFDVIICT
jgi:hypothetical protein